MNIIDIAIASTGRPVVLTDEGQILTEDQPSDLAFSHLPQSQRPSAVWREIEPPEGVMPAKIVCGQHGALTLLADGRLFERERDPDNMIGVHYRWRELRPGETAPVPVNPPAPVQTQVLRVGPDGKPIAQQPAASVAGSVSDTQETLKLAGRQDAFAALAAENARLKAELTAATTSKRKSR